MSYGRSISDGNGENSAPSSDRGNNNLSSQVANYSGSDRASAFNSMAPTGGEQYLPTLAVMGNEITQAFQQLQQTENTIMNMFNQMSGGSFDNAGTQGPSQNSAGFDNAGTQGPSQNTTGFDNAGTQGPSQNTTGFDNGGSQAGSQNSTGFDNGGSQAGSQNSTGFDNGGAQAGSQNSTGLDNGGAQAGSQSSTGFDNSGAQNWSPEPCPPEPPPKPTPNPPTPIPPPAPTAEDKAVTQIDNQVQQGNSAAGLSDLNQTLTQWRTQQPDQAAGMESQLMTQLENTSTTDGMSGNEVVKSLGIDAIAAYFPLYASDKRVTAASLLTDAAVTADPVNKALIGGAAQWMEQAGMAGPVQNDVFFAGAVANGAQNQQQFQTYLDQTPPAS